MTKTAAYKMMKGSEGKADYMVFARRGGIALGIKMVAVARGESLGVEGTTWFAGRLRSAPSGNLFEEEDQKVVKLEKVPDNNWDAWPEVVWEKKAKDRSSTTV